MDQMVNFRLEITSFSGGTTCAFCAMSNFETPATLDGRGHHASVCPCAEGNTTRHSDLHSWLWRTLKTLTPDLLVHREKPLL